MILIPFIAKGESLECHTKSDGSISIHAKVPHPNNALIHRPEGKTVWLQTSPHFVHKQMNNFSQRSNWIINKQSMGTVWEAGVATKQSIIKGKGKYHLYIAENLETEKENTNFVECYFIVK